VQVYLLAVLRSLKDVIDRANGLNDCGYGDVLLFSISNRKHAPVLAFGTATESYGAPNVRQDGVCCGCVQIKRTQSAVRVTQGHIRHTTHTTRPAGSVRDVAPGSLRPIPVIPLLTPFVMTVPAAESLTTWTSCSSAVRMRRKDASFMLK
jgi:hypothetical protein